MSVIGLSERFFFYKASGNTAIVTGENYLKLLQEFAMPQNQARRNLAHFLIQQDGDPTHLAILMRDFLNIKFSDWWIHRMGYVSPDLKPCDVFLRSYIKCKMYITKPRDLSQLGEKNLQSLQRGR